MRQRLADLPVSWSAALVCHGEYGHPATGELIHQRVREMAEMVVTNATFVFWPVVGGSAKAIDCTEKLASEGFCGNRASFEVPEKCFASLRLRVRQYRNVEGTHKEPRRWRTSVQGAGCTCPACNSSRLRFTSTLHASEIATSSALSRLSKSATAKAERSSAGRPRTSSNRWSTRAFMGVQSSTHGVPRTRSLNNMSFVWDGCAALQL